MVILQINKFFFEKGGSERYFFALSDALSARGHSVAHFSMAHPDNRPSPYASYFVARRDYDGTMGPRASLRSAAGFIRSREAARKVAALARDIRPDVAHLHNIYHQLTPSIIDSLADAGVPAVMTLHDYKLVCPNYSLFAHSQPCERCQGRRFHRAVTTRCAGSLARSALLAAESYWQQWTGVYGRLHTLISPSRFLRDRVVAAGFDERRVAHVPQFVSNARDNGAITVQEAALLDSLPQRYAFYFGRLSEEKGVHVLIDAMTDLTEIPLVVAGDGPMRAELKWMCEQRSLHHVHFTGHARRPLLERMLARAAVSVVPSLFPENAPLTVVESASAGVPLVVSDRGGLPEMAQVVGARVVRAEDTHTLRDAIAGIWSDRGQARAAATRWESARAYFDRDTHLARLEGIYTAAVDGGVPA